MRNVLIITTQITYSHITFSTDKSAKFVTKVATKVTHSILVVSSIWPITKLLTH